MANAAALSWKTALIPRTAVIDVALVGVGRSTACSNRFPDLCDLNHGDQGRGDTRAHPRRLAGPRSLRASARGGLLSMQAVRPRVFAGDVTRGSPKQGVV